MTQVSQSAMVPHDMKDMLALVNDVDAYPKFLKWCEKGYVISQDDGGYVAGIMMNISGIQVEFVTSNEVQMGDDEIHLDMKLVKGPFKQLSGHWQFKNIENLGSRVNLNLQYEIKSQVLGRVFAKGFNQLAGRMVNDFVNRARVLYG